MQEDYEESISSTLRTRSSKKPKNARRKLETPLVPALLCWTNNDSETRSKTNDFKSKIACILEASESTRMRMEESLPKYHEDGIAGKGTVHYNITIWYTNFSYASSNEDSRSKSSSGWRMGEIWKDSVVEPDESQQQIWRDWWSKKRRAQKYTSLHWWTSVIWRMPNWRQSTKKYKGRVVLRVDIAKDDSGSYAVFTEQGSSASQMTAAKAGQAADAVSAYTQFKMEDNPKLLKIPNSECPQMDSSTTTQMA